MKGLVWALYVMVQDPAASAIGWAFTGVTYHNKQACISDAATFIKMPTESKTDGVLATSRTTYVCILQPKPGHYRG